MELSRFDARAEQADSSRPTSAPRFGRSSPPGCRAPMSTPRTFRSSSPPTCGGSIGSSATSSTTPASTPREAPVEVTVGADGGEALRHASPIAGRAWRRTPWRTSSTASTRPTPRATAASSRPRPGHRRRARRAARRAASARRTGQGGGLEVTLRLPVTGSLPERDGPDTGEADARTDPGRHRRRPSTRGPTHERTRLAHLRPPRRPCAARRVVGACSPLTGDLGSVATPPPSEQPSLELPSDEPTPGSTGGPTSSGATPSPSPGAPGASPRRPAPARPRSAPTSSSAASSDNAGLVPVLREIPEDARPSARPRWRRSSPGPNDAELGARPAMYTTIPEGTRFLGLTHRRRRRHGEPLARVRVGGGGSASVLGPARPGRLHAHPVPDRHRRCASSSTALPVTVFSGEGVVLDQPVGRADYTDQLPAIFVDRPAWGGVLGNPARLVGMANVFEATFRVRILDGAGHKLRRRRSWPAAAPAAGARST